MRRFAVPLIRFTAVALWGVAVAGIWLLPVSAVVVVTGAAVTGATFPGATDKRFLLRAVADIAQLARSRRDPGPGAPS